MITLLNAALLLWILPMAGEPAAGRIEVRSNSGRVDVHATAVPLSAVLDRLGREAGFKVVYEGTPPGQLVSVELDGVTPEEAVAQLVEGLGLSFALRLDPAGTRIDTAVFTQVAAPKAGSRATTPAAPPPATPAALPAAGSDPVPPVDPVAPTDLSDEEAEAAAHFDAMPAEAHDPQGANFIAAGPPVPPRPAGVPTSPWIPYEGSLNPPAPEAGRVNGKPNTGPAVLNGIKPPVLGEVVELDGMGPGGVPGRELKERVPSH
jgi:hypothetical protein